MYKTETDFSKVPTCKDHPGAGAVIVLTPETVHYGKYVCPVCERYLAFAAKPDGDKRQRRGSAKLTKKLEADGICYCQMCLRKRDELPPNATFVAHHVIEVQDGGGDEPDNLWYLCTICHEMIHLLRRNRANPKDRPTPVELDFEVAW